MKRSVKTTVVVGAAIGALNLTHYWATAQQQGVDIPFGIFPGGFPIAALTGITGRTLSPQLAVMLVLGLGIIAGSAWSAFTSPRPTQPLLLQQRLGLGAVAQAFFGGIVMAMGIWMAGGCPNKHALSGTPGLMLSSWVTLAGIVAAVWLISRSKRSA